MGIVQPPALCTCHAPACWRPDSPCSMPIHTLYRQKSLPEFTPQHPCIHSEKSQHHPQSHLLQLWPAMTQHCCSTACEATHSISARLHSLGCCSGLQRSTGVHAAWQRMKAARQAGRAAEGPHRITGSTAQHDTSLTICHSRPPVWGFGFAEPCSSVCTRRRIEPAAFLHRYVHESWQQVAASFVSSLN
jgi:hypothetical protein